MYSHILVPVDGSPEAEHAVSHALHLADLTGATIHALYVVGPRSRDDRSAVERGERALEDVRERAAEFGVDAETRVGEGDPAETIASYVDRTSADLVVMGTHGREGVDRLLNGSVAERVGRRVTVPVMTLRLGEQGHSVTSPLGAQRIAREKLAHTGHEAAVVESPSPQRSSWVVPASDDRGEYNVHVDSASGRAKVVKVG